MSYDFELTESDYMTAGSLSDLNANGTNFSIVVWIKPESFPSYAAAASLSVAGSTSWNNNHINLGTNTSGYAKGYRESTNVTQTVATTVSAWNMIAFRYDLTGTTMYIDSNGDTAVSTSATLAVADTTLLTIGANGYDTQGDFYDGKIAEVALYNSFLSGANIATLYNSGDGNSMDSVSGLVWHRHLYDDITSGLAGTDSLTNNGATVDSADHPFAVSSTTSDVNYTGANRGIMRGIARGIG